MNPPRSDRWVTRYAQWVLRWRIPVILVSLLLAFGAGFGAQRLTFSQDYRLFFGPQNPQLQAYDALQRIYTKNDNLMFVVTPPHGEVFTPEALETVRQLTAEAWKLPFANRVDSITNFQHTRAVGDDLWVGDLFPDPMAMTPIALAEARQVALAEPALKNRIISETGAVTGVNVTLQIPEETEQTIGDMVAEARVLAAEFEERYPGTEIRLTGTAALNNAFAESSSSDMATLLPLMFLAIAVTMWFLLRSVSGTVATLAVVALSAITAMGLAGWMGFQITAPVASAPTMILTLAVADSIHVLVTMLNEMRHGRSKQEAIVESLRVNFSPVFLTSFTTAIGFLSMNFSDSPPFRDLGNITAMGVLAAWLFSLFLLPALMSFLPVRVKTAEEEPAVQMGRFADLVVRRRRPLLWGTSALALALIAFIPMNELNDQFVEYFDERVDFRRDTDYASANLTGIYQLEFSLDSGESGGIADPAYLAKIEEFTNWLEAHPKVLQVTSFSQVMKRLNKSLHADDPAWYRTPEQQDLAAQYLLLYEMSLPFGLDLNNQINVDRSATRLIATMRDISAVELREAAAEAEQWLRDNARESMWTAAASTPLMFAHISERNIKSMLTGILLAIVLIAGCLVVALRSLKIGLLSLIPNLLPAGMAFGLWGIFVGEIGIAISVVAGMTLGIVVDDSIHFLSKYLRARREKGLDPTESVRYAFSTVGRALVVTTIVLVAGFGVLSFSAFAVNSGMARLTLVAIVLALAADFTLLPALLMHMERKEIREAPSPAPARHESLVPAK